MPQSIREEDWLTDYASAKAQSIWEYAHVVRENHTLLGELGFSDPSKVADVVIALRAGDRLHPTKGFDYLGPDWRQLEEAEFYRQLDTRSDEVEQILREVLRVLESDGYDAAVQCAQSASPYQVVFLSRNQSETEQCVQHLLDLGLGTNELSDNLLEKHGSFLVIGYDENISYYYLGDG